MSFLLGVTSGFLVHGVTDTVCGANLSGANSSKKDFTPRTSHVSGLEASAG